MAVSPYVILSTARSGSTALAQLLDAAVNGHCASEPMPNLNRECRWALDGRLTSKEIDALVDEVLVPRLVEGSRNHGVYGEKNVTYGPFIEALSKKSDCRFVLLTRDGREVVRSLLDWHTHKFGNVYREAVGATVLQPEARTAAANLLVCDDSSDYARQRPQPQDQIYDSWEHLTRRVMCGWYWSACNKVYEQALEKVSKDRVFRIDLARDGIAGVKELYQFLELETPGEDHLATLLNQRINSLADRGASTEDRSLAWPWWSGDMRDDFERVAGAEMTRLGYWGNDRSQWRPEGYGRFWQAHEGGLEWYTWMYDSRRQVHENLLSFVDSQPKLQSIADFGCGLGVGYADAFADRRYVGFDLAKSAIAWCQAHRSNGHHDYRSCDFVTADPDEQFDLVFSQGTIDNSYDMDAYLTAMTRWSRGWIYVTCYRGWFPELDDHRYSWNPEHACAYNDLSPARAQRVLERLGCEDIEIAPIVTGNAAIPRETRIIARVPV